MGAEVLLNELTRIVHELWRARMERDGWTSGPYNPDERTHDALVPFEQLSRGDRLAVSLHTRAEEFEDSLPRLLDYPRGANRPFLLEEMKPGLKVAFCVQSCPEQLSQVPHSDLGTIASWEVTESGELGRITVHWNDGAVESYGPWERALVRVSELR